MANQTVDSWSSGSISETIHVIGLTVLSICMQYVITLIKSLKEQFESMKTQRDEFDAQLTEKKQHLDEINAKLLDAENKVRAVAHKYTTHVI